MIFNRPDLTRRIFEEIRRARPRQLLVVADGPRSDRLGESAKCAAARQVLSRVDWPCEVRTNFSETNLGCKRRISSGLTWVFSQVEEAIILEDDCLPHPTFFRFCEELLERYRDDERVFHISGTHYRFEGERTRESYYFSRYNFIWGWASWRRAWAHYDVEMKQWPQVRDGGWLNDFFGGKSKADPWIRSFQSIYDGEVDTWDYQWALAFWINHGLSIRPHVNLISNIGFGEDATHTTGESPNANLTTEAMLFPLQHPPFMMPNGYEDSFLPQDMAKTPLTHRIKGKLKRVLRALAARAS